MNEYLLDFFNNNNLNIENKKLTLAVSTGVDSMALLISFMELKKVIPFEIIVCHVNHNRREQSKIEEEFIKSFSLEHNLKCYVKNLEFKEDSNFQARARDERYQFFYEVMDQENSEILLLAHHGDDLIETILMRILRGSSLSGYSGIKSVIEYENKKVARPFLNLSKEEIIDYQNEKGFKYFEDISNSHLDYTRNKVRHLIVPALKEVENNAMNKFFEFSKNITDVSNFFMEYVKKFISEKVTVCDNEICFLLGDFLELDEYIQKEVLFEILKDEKLSLKNVLEMIKWIKSDKKNIKNEYKGLTFLKEYDKITFSKEKKEILDIDIKIEGLGKYRVNDTISINVLEKDANDVTNLSELCYNIQRLPIHIRSRKNGDKILLSSGYKKIKDLLIDEKIGISKRNNILLAVDEEENVLMVFGVKKSRILKSINDNNIIIRVEENHE